MNQRRESVKSELYRSMTGDEYISILTTSQSRPSWHCLKKDDAYPFSHVLRIRVLKIVCGILEMIMGSVAVIEQNGSISNLGLGLPAGVFTILATAVSIHTSKGFGGYRPASVGPDSCWRILGPTVKKAITLTVLWTSALSLNIALVAQSVHVLRPIHFQRPSETCLILAIIQLVLSATILLSLFVVIKIDLTHEPD